MSETDWTADLSGRVVASMFLGVSSHVRRSTAADSPGHGNAKPDPRRLATALAPSGPVVTHAVRHVAGDPHSHAIPEELGNVKNRDHVAPPAVMAPACHADRACRENEGGVANLDDAAQVRDVHPLAGPHLLGHSCDLIAAAALVKPTARNEYSARFKDLSESRLVTKHERVLKEGFKLLGGCRSGRHAAPQNSSPWRSAIGIVPSKSTFPP